MSAGPPTDPDRAPGPDVGAAAEPNPLTAGPPTRIDPSSADARGEAAASGPAGGSSAGGPPADPSSATADAPTPPLPPGVRRYTRDGAAVTYEVALCRHAAECVRGLPRVFDTTQRPWIQPQNASVDELEVVIASCPTRALKLERDPAIRGPATPA